ncbi:MAG: hypothetical protein ACE364_00985 [Chlorobiota bacterium]
MKKLLTNLVFILCIALVATSCKDEDDSTGPSDLKIGEMTATVGGDDFKAGNALYFNSTNLVSGGEQVGGLTNLYDVNTISVQLAQVGGEPEVKSYTAICFYQETRGSAPGATTTESWNANNGTCEITEIDGDMVKGTFSFTGTNSDDGTTKKVSGSFYVQRQG